MPKGTIITRQRIVPPTSDTGCHAALPVKRQWLSTSHRVPCTLKSANHPIFAPTFLLPDTTVTYTWDTANRLAQVRIPGESAIVWNTYTWTAPAKITYPGGSTRHIAHDPLLRIQRITARDPTANAVLDYRYEYDPVGNITQKATEHGTYAYEYDPRDRLTRAANPTLPDEAYGYDPADKLTSDASLPGPWTYDEANANAPKPTPTSHSSTTPTAAPPKRPSPARPPATSTTWKTASRK